MTSRLQRLDRWLLRRPRLRRWVRRGGFGFGAFVLGYVLTALIFFPGSDQLVVTVPDLRGDEANQARERAEELGLRIVEGSAIHHPTVPEGAVVAQVPLAGEEVLEGSAVRFIVSRGPELRPVPEVVGMRERDALRLLLATGFRVRRDSAFSSQAVGRVVGVRPGTGTRAPTFRVVTMTLSRGVRLVPVPSLEGLTLAAADSVLRAGELRVGEVRRVRVSWLAPGLVADQSPAAGTAAPVGSGVLLRIAADPAEVVPAVTDSAVPAPAEPITPRPDSVLPPKEPVPPAGAGQ